MTFVVNMRWGHLDRLPKCIHGRVEGYCDCFDRPLTPMEDARASFKPLICVDDLANIERERGCAPTQSS